MSIVPCRAILALALVAVSPIAPAADGDLDLSFGQAGKRTVPFDLGGNNIDTVAGVSVVSGSTIYLAGHVDAPLGTTQIALARLLADGTPDGLFGSKGRVTANIAGIDTPRILDMAAQIDGKLVVAGTVRVGNPADGNFDMLACRFHGNGEVDAGFGSPQTPGCITVPVDFTAHGRDSAQALAIQGNGGIILAGQAQIAPARSNGVVVRLNANGTLDGSFGAAGIVDFTALMTPNPGSTMALADVALAGDGKIVVAGHITFTANDSDFVVARFDPGTGAADPSFSTGGIALVGFDLNTTSFQLHDRGKRIAILADNSVLVAGDVQIGSSSVQMGVARLDALGQLDNSFGTGGKRMHIFCDVCINASVSGLLVVGNEIVLAGTVSGDLNFFKPDFGVMRLTSNGAIDTSFGDDGRRLIAFGAAGDNTEDRLTSIAVQGSQLLVAGQAQLSLNSPFNRDFAIARIDN